MNIDLISNVTSPPRPPQTEVAVATRQPEAKLKTPEAAKPLPVADDQNQKAPDKFSVRQAVEKLAEFVSSRQSELSFSIDDASGSQIVKIMDIQTKQVIRQFPSEEAVAIAQALDKLQGLLIRDKA